MQIVLDVPDQLLLTEPKEALVDRMKLYVALMMFRTGQLSAGAACELAGVDRYTFLAACKQHGILAVDYAPDELEAELTWPVDADSASS